MTLPLLEGTDGVRKMSKSYGNQIAIEDPPNELFGKIMSISDEMMARYYELLLGQKLREGHPREQKEELAKILSTRFYGKKLAEKAAKEFLRVFRQKETPLKMKTFRVSSSGLALDELLVKSGLASSHREAARLVKQGGVRLGGERLTDPKQKIQIQQKTVLQAGKRNFRRIIPS